ncbi:hypothetical protein AHAS_Ahas03G0365000 [Arachis hypogaea]
MKLRNVTVVTTTMSVGAPYSEAVALRGLVPLHVPLQQRLPVFDGVVDLVRCGRAVNRWIPVTMMEFLLFDVDRVLRSGGYLWIDRFFSKGVDLEKLKDLPALPVFMRGRVLGIEILSKAKAKVVDNWDEMTKLQ